MKTTMFTGQLQKRHGRWMGSAARKYYVAPAVLPNITEEKVTFLSFSHLICFDGKIKRVHKPKQQQITNEQIKFTYKLFF